MNVLAQLMLLASAATLGAQAPIARVGDAVITREVLEENVARALQGQYQHTRVSEEKLHELRVKELAVLIRRQLLVAGAKDRGLALPLAEARRQVAAMEAQLGREEYQKSLKARGWSKKDHERVLAETLLAEEAYKRFVLNPSAVSEEEIVGFFRANQARFQWPEALHLQHILLKVPATADAKTREKREREAKDLMKRLKAGEDFAALASQFSNDAYRVKGGDLGWVHRGRLVEPLETVVWAARVGELVGPVRSSEGFHLVKVLERRMARPMTLDEARPIIQRELSEKKRLEAEQRFFSAVKTRHPVVILDASLAHAAP
ncbi:MAG: peptidylprolyl isomerase [Thermoanaerobaculum sp.]